MSLRRAVTMIGGNLDKVRAINRRYAHPRLTISPAVRVCLLVLRLYLLFLVGLLAYKFVTIVIG
jgi:hypothetical protein